jgi:hypothetical protein
VADTREILHAREMTHSVHTVDFAEYVREDGTKVEAGSKAYCMRCGAVEGTERFQKGCRSVSLPNAAFEFPRPAVRIPRRGGHQPYSNDLAEYFDLADWFGGLASTLGGVLDRQRDGGSVLNNHVEPRLPAYMHDSQTQRRQRLTETWQALTTFRWSDQVVLRNYYSGVGHQPPVEDLRALHDAFEIRLRSYRKPKKRKAADPHSDRTWSTKELADRAGVSRQHMSLLLKEADVGEVPDQTGLGQPARVIKDSELDELRQEFAA